MGSKVANVDKTGRVLCDLRSGEDEGEGGCASRGQNVILGIRKRKGWWCVGIPEAMSVM